MASTWGRRLTRHPARHARLRCPLAGDGPVHRESGQNEDAGAGAVTRRRSWLSMSVYRCMVTLCIQIRQLQYIGEAAVVVVVAPFPLLPSHIPRARKVGWGCAAAPPNPQQRDARLELLT